MLEISVFTIAASADYRNEARHIANYLSLSQRSAAVVEIGL